MSLMRRRMMIQGSAPVPTPVLPDEYQQIEYVNRPSTAGTGGYNTTALAMNTSKTYEVRIGFMATGTQTTSYGYPIACRQKASDNTIGFGINVNQDTTDIGVWNGTLCTIEPKGGASHRNTRYDIVATWAPNGHISITDGVHFNELTATPRSIYSTLILFGLLKSNSQLSQQFVGRIYYCTILENGIVKVNMIPCREKSTGHIGWYDEIAGSFRYAGSYTAGEDVY